MVAYLSEPFKCQSHKKVKHTQTIRRKIAEDLFEWISPFCVVAAYRVKKILTLIPPRNTRKTFGFFMYLGGTKLEQWPEMG